MLLENHNAIESGGYQIQNSLRFSASSSSYLSRTPASAGNRQTWTWSGWVKLGSLGVQRPLFYNSNGATANGHGGIYIESTNQLWFNGTDNGSAYTNAINTNAVLRDPSAWYHIVVVCDTTNATAANRQLIYINGVLQSCTVTQAVTLNANLQINKATRTDIGDFGYTGGTSYNDGYMTEVNFVDGQALTPSSFGTTDTTTGQWVAKKYAGSYGTNGFYLPFSNGTSTTTLGADSSGNSNNWTLTNFTRSAGVNDCWMFDVPSGNGGVSGTQPSSNYAVLQAPKGNSAGQSVITNANLKSTLGGTGSWRSIASTIAPVSGKWYTEFNLTNAPSSDGVMFGVSTLNANIFNVNSFYGGTADSWAMYTQSGQKWNSGSASAYGNSATTGDIIGIALDLDNGAIYYSKNGVWQNSGVPTSGASKTGAAFSLTTGSEYYIGYGAPSAQVVDANFGQRSFAYTPPSGFKALCTANLPAATIKQGNTVFDATTYTGNGSNQNLTNINFQPDIFWGKSRSAVNNHGIVDSVRGGMAALYSNLTNAEGADGIVNSFNSNGVSLGNSATTNANGQSFVGWMWDAGSSTVTNTNGTISSQVRANPTAGVSVVTYTGTGSLATVGHGLGVAPKMMIVKNRTSATSWAVYSSVLGATQVLALNSTAAAGFDADVFGGTTPTSSVFSLGADTWTNASANNYVAYCFAEIAGFSKAFSYTGNGSADGPFVYCGFRPKFVMIKRSDAAGYSWYIWDSVRNPYNAAQYDLYPNASDAEGSGDLMDILSNGFKMRDVGASRNASGGTYIYMAFAENPFQHSNAR
jgi:hypothetical protein